MPVSIAYVADLTPEHLRGRYMGVYGLTWALALTTGPALGAFLFAWNPTLLWGSSLGMGVLASLVILLPSGKRAERLLEGGVAN
jgi:MFS family permease